MISIRSLFGGLAFTSASFRWLEFATAVACARRARALRSDREGYAAMELDEFLVPDVARRVYDHVLGRDGRHSDLGLTPEQGERATRVLNYVKSICPQWGPLLDFPLEIRVTERPGVIGYSNATIPQHVYLSERALASDSELREQLLHEVAHVWVYMLEELWDMHDHGDTTRFTLPSGTGNKTATGVMNAAFVAVVLSRFYWMERGPLAARAGTLLDYAQESTGLLEKYSGLTPMGVEARTEILDAIRARLAEQRTMR